MTRKALIVGISDYSPIAPDLPSSTTEIRAWRELLRSKCGFPTSNIHLLENQLATKAAMVGRLTWLFAHAKPCDQLVFIFCGHGARVPRRHELPIKDDLYDEALVLYPRDAQDPVDVAFWDDELTNFYRRMSVPCGVAATFILDCCFSGGVDFSELPRLEGVRLPTTGLTSYEHITNELVQFGRRLTNTKSPAPPLIVTAGAATDLANEIDEGERKRSAFSAAAIAALEHDPCLTYEQWIAATRARQKNNKRASVRGEADRVCRQVFH